MLKPPLNYRRNVSGVRQILQDFIEGIIHLPEYSMAYPNVINTDYIRKAATIIFLPMENSEYNTEGETYAEGTGEFNIAIRYKYAHELDYHEIGIARMELLYEVLNIKALQQIAKYGHIQRLSTNPVPFPVSVRREEAEQLDWAIDINLSFIVNYNIVDLDLPEEFGEPIPDGPPITTIRIRTYASGIPVNVADSTTHTLDLDYLKTRALPG